MRCFLNTLLALVALAGTGCDEPNKAAEQQQSVHAVSGVLQVFLHRRDAIGLYVRFALETHEKNTTVTTIADSGIISISEHPIPFSLAYPRHLVKQERAYLLAITVLEDPEGAVELTSMSVPVLTQGHPSVVNLAVQPPPEPIE